MNSGVDLVDKMEFVVESCVADRMYSYILESYRDRIHRIRIYKKRFLIINARNVSILFEDFLKDEIISRYINRIFLLNKKAKNIKEILIKSKSFTPLRIQAYPKNLQEKILKMFEGSVELSPTKFDYILYVFEDNDYLYGIFPKKYFFRKKDIREKPISSAYYKILEAIKRFKIPLSKDWVVLDLGAAPGGWTQYLSKRVKTVVSVDPAELFFKGKNVIHVKKKLEECFNEIMIYSPYNMVCCDVNQDPREVARHLIKISRFLKKDGYLLMTVKLIYKSRRNRKKLLEDTIRILKNSYRIIGVKWLLSNSKNERMLCAVCKS